MGTGRTALIRGCVGNALVLACVLLALGGCGHEAAPFAPSPLIVPDATSVPAGQSQVFAVQNATVVTFSLSCDGCDWKQFVTVDSTFHEPNAIRLVAIRSPKHNLYVAADLGPHRSPLVAVFAIE